MQYWFDQEISLTHRDIMSIVVTGCYLFKHLIRKLNMHKMNEIVWCWNAY